MPSRLRPAVWGVGVLLALLSGCASSDSEPELVSQSRFAERFASVWCESVAPCCASERVGFERVACQTQARDFTAAMLSTRMTGDTSYSAEAGTRCLERLANALKTCDAEQANNACGLIFVGALPQGTPCRNGSDCVSGYCAQSEAPSGVCTDAVYQPPVHGALGQPCVGSCGVPGSFECPTSILPSAEGTTTYCYAEDGLYCTFDPQELDTLSCQPYAAVGDACTDVTCTPGAFCADETCLAQRSSGSCEDTAERCTAQSYCDATQRCQAKKPNRGACSTGEECMSSSCNAEGVCDSGSASLARACRGDL